MSAVISSKSDDGSRLIRHLHDPRDPSQKICDHVTPDLNESELLQFSSARFAKVA
jgi:hypothetical protein